MKRIRRHWHWIITAAVIALLILAGRKVDWAVAGRVLRHADLFTLAIAVIVNILSIALRGVRWWLFLRRLGPVPLAVAVRGSLVGAGLNNLLVANGGDATRMLLVARATGLPRSAVVAAAAIDRLFDPICYLLVLLVATFVVPLPSQLDGARPIVTIALLAALVLLMRLARERTADVAAGEITGLRRHLANFAFQVREVSSGPVFFWATLLSVGVWGIQIATFAIVARSARVTLPIAGSIAALLLTNTGLVLRATPGNVGYFQAAYAIAAARFGVATGAAVGAAVLLQLVQMVPTTLISLGLARGFTAPK